MKLYTMVWLVLVSNTVSKLAQMKQQQLFLFVRRVLCLCFFTTQHPPLSHSHTPKYSSRSTNSFNFTSFLAWMWNYFCLALFLSVAKAQDICTRLVASSEAYQNKSVTLSSYSLCILKHIISNVYIKAGFLLRTTLFVCYPLPFVFRSVIVCYTPMIDIWLW